MSKVINSMFSLEGIDGAGKSTQLPLIAAHLQKLGILVQTVASPSNGVRGQYLRQHVRELNSATRNKLFLEDMVASLQMVPEENNLVILWDRYIDSFYASNREMTKEEANQLTKELPKPKLTFLLEIGPEYIFSERRQAINHHSDPEWLNLKVARYQELAADEPNRFVVINARQPIVVITEKIVSLILNNYMSPST